MNEERLIRLGSIDWRDGKLLWKRLLQRRVAADRAILEAN
jgi:hypothetical protein